MFSCPNTAVCFDFLRYSQFLWDFVASIFTKFFLFSRCPFCSNLPCICCPESPAVESRPDQLISRHPHPSVQTVVFALRSTRFVDLSSMLSVFGPNPDSSSAGASLPFCLLTIKVASPEHHIWTKYTNEVISHDVWKNVPCVVLKERGHRRDLAVDGRIMFQWILNKWGKRS